MTKRDWLIIFILYMSFWAYLAIDNYKAKKRLEEAISLESENKFKVGDYIITVAGIYGKIIDIKGEKTLIELEDKAVMKVSINSILEKVS